MAKIKIIPKSVSIKIKPISLITVSHLYHLSIKIPISNLALPSIKSKDVVKEALKSQKTNNSHIKIVNHYRKVSKKVKKTTILNNKASNPKILECKLKYVNHIVPVHKISIIIKMYTWEIKEKY
jgi:hypothetical protein